MSEVVHFHPSHLIALRGRPEERMFLGDLPDLDVYARACAVPGLSFSIIADEGEPVACGGVFQIWTGVAHAWAFMSEDSRKHTMKMHRETLKFLDRANSKDFVRIQTQVKASWPEAMKWARKLGFEQETDRPMRKYGLDGQDYHMFARVV